MREQWYVAEKADGGRSMRIFKTKRLALNAARKALAHDPNVEVGPMLDTRGRVLSGDELRRVVGLADRF